MSEKFFIAYTNFTYSPEKKTNKKINKIHLLNKKQHSRNMMHIKKSQCINKYIKYMAICKNEELLIKLT